MIVAIDGHAGSGKSTLGRRLARETGMLYIDTGAMYRAVGLYLTDRTLPAEPELEELLARMDLRMEVEADQFRILLDGADVTERLRGREVGQTASRVASMGAVRRRLTALVRSLRPLGDLVVDGRDIGTVVFPDADLKVFLTASAEERARRRHLDAAGGRAETMQKTQQEIEQRDRADSSRSLAPLARAADAVTLDTTRLTQEEAFRRLVELVHERAGRSRGPT
jgi:cytidylate kinase